MRDVNCGEQRRSRKRAGATNEAHDIMSRRARRRRMKAAARAVRRGRCRWTPRSVVPYRHGMTTATSRASPREHLTHGITAIGRLLTVGPRRRRERPQSKHLARARPSFVVDWTASSAAARATRYLPSYTGCSSLIFFHQARFERSVFQAVGGEGEGASGLRCGVARRVAVGGEEGGE
eukprot:COSAG06_NODE_8358_length_2194_cov_2.898807_2_plen_178_part_00